jgi:hypothetical protein
MGEIPDVPAGDAPSSGAEPPADEKSEGTSPETLAIGEYRTLAELSRGTHGITYRATRAGSDTPVALKAMPATPASERIMARARGFQPGLAALRHENIATFMELGYDESQGMHFIAAEYVEGDVLDALVKSRGALQEPDVMAIGIQIANALGCVYGRKLFHGDIRPSHVLITRGGIVKLVGLGLSLPSFADDDASPTDAHYVSPEAGDIDRLDIRSDVYSLGATLYHAITGAPPFAGKERPRVIASHKDAQIPSPSDVVVGVSSGLSRIITRMMAKQPDERYRTPTELTLDLNIVKEGQEPVIAATAPSKSTVAPSKTAGAGTPAAKPPRAAGGRQPTHSHLRKIAAGRTAKTAHVVRAIGPQHSKVGKIVAAVGGGVAVLILGLVLFFSGDARHDDEPSPLVPAIVAVETRAPRVPLEPSPPPAVPEANAAQRAKGLLLEARDFASANPDDVAGLLSRFQSCLAAAHGTPLQEEVEREIASLQKRRKDAARLALNGAVASAEHLVAAGDVDAALARLDEIPADLTADIADDVEGARSEIAREGDEKLDAVLAAVEALLDEAKPSEARIAIMALDAVRYAEGRKTIEAREAALMERIRSVEESVRTQAEGEARKALPGLLAKFDELVDQHQYWDAQDLMSASSKRPELAPLAGVLASAALVAAELGLRTDAMAEAVSALVGTEIALQTEKGVQKGVVKDADSRGVALAVKLVVNGRVMGETKQLVSWSDLTPDDQDRLAQAYEPNGDKGMRAARAILAMERGDLDGARKLLDEAGDFQLVDHIRMRIDTKRLGEGEAKARAAWRALEPRLKRPRFSSAEAKALGRLLAEFAEEHAGSAFLKSVEGELHDAIERAASADPDAAATGTIPDDAFTFNGNRYKAYESPAAYAAARKACESLGGHLVTLTSQEEADFVFEKLVKDSGASTLIGLSDLACEGCWVWDTGEPYVYGDWESNEPNNTNNAEHCAITGWRGSISWNDVPPALAYRYVCEWDSPRWKAAAQRLAETGLLGTYYKDAALSVPVMRRLDSQICFLWGGHSPDAQRLTSDTFSIRWEGLIVPAEGGAYTFEAWVDDRAKIWVGGELLLDFAGEPGTYRSKAARLSAGAPVAVKIEYVNSGGQSTMRLRWSRDGGDTMLVEPQYLRPPKDYLKQKNPPLVKPGPGARQSK